CGFTVPPPSVTHAAVYLNRSAGPVAQGEPFAGAAGGDTTSHAAARVGFIPQISRNLEIRNGAYAELDANTFPGAHLYADAASGWSDSVTVTSSTPGQLTLRFFFESNGILDAWAGGIQRVGFASHSVVVFSSDINGFTSAFEFGASIRA